MRWIGNCHHFQDHRNLRLPSFLRSTTINLQFNSVLQIYGVLLGVLALLNLGGGIWLYTRVDALSKPQVTEELNQEYSKLSGWSFSIF